MFNPFPIQHQPKFLSTFPPQPPQDFLLPPVYHKHPQSHLLQSDLLSQMIDLKVQAGILKILSQEKAATTYRDINTHPLPLTNYRLPNTISSMPDHYDQIMYNKMRQREQILTERARQARQATYIKQEVADTYESPIEDLSVPAIPALLQENRHFESPDLSGEDTNSLSSRSKKM